MTGAELRKLAASPEAFRAALFIDTDNAGLARLGDRIEDWQAKDFAALDPGWMQVAGLPGECRYQRAYLERPRGHSKTSDLAVMAAWVLFASRRRLSGVAAAADRDQARLLRDAIEKLVRANPWLGEAIEVLAHKIVNKRTGSELEILSSDAASSYGLTPDFIIVDELTHWGKRDLWDSLISAAAKRARCFVVIIANAGWADTWQYETREAIRTDADWYFSRLDGPCASWISEKHLAEQRRLLPAQAFDRLWLNRWAFGKGDALSPQDIEYAIHKRARPLEGPEQGWRYFMGVDIGIVHDSTAVAVVAKHVGWRERPEADNRRLPSTLAALQELGLATISSSDRSMILINHPGTGALRLAAMKAWKPTGGRQVDLTAVEDHIVWLNQRLGLTAVHFDPHQAVHLMQRLRRRGVRCVSVDQGWHNQREQASETLAAFTERRIDLMEDAQLIRDLRALRVEESRTGGFRLTSPRNSDGHGDSATSLMIAIRAAQRAAAQTIDRPLLAAVYES